MFESPPELQQKLVLLIEDDTVLLETLAKRFAAAGCEVMTAPDGQAGLLAFEQVRPDLVVTDIIMPEREGVETIMAMRARSATVPILAISGGGRRGTAELLSLALGLGASAALAKPFRTQELLALSASLVEQAPRAA